MPANLNSDTKSWAVILEEDPATGDLFLPFPVDLLSQMGWSEGTEIFWDVQDNGSVIISEKKDDNAGESEALESSRIGRSS